MVRILEAVANDFRKLAVFLAIIAVACIAFGVGLGLTVTTTGAFASDTSTTLIQACVNKNTGAVEMAPPGQSIKCHPKEILIEWQNATAFSALASRVHRLETESASLAMRLSALESQVPDCLSEVDGDAVFSGCNVQVNNDEGSTATKNGTGNLIVGYNENNPGYDRSGSHNVVVGIDHGYSQWGGLVVGERNRITGDYSSVSGGWPNYARGDYSSVSGGSGNRADGDYSSVSGGQINMAVGDWSAIGGGGEPDRVGSA